ncbi:MAG: hypothetical protein ACOCWJ_01980, partial [Verrucomicrobiota bacterium]
MLVVIAIIAILAAMLLPALQGARQSALRGACTENLRQQAMGVLLYANDNVGEIPPFRETRESLYTPWLAEIAYFWSTGEPANLGHLHAQDYLSEPAIFYCPGAHTNFRNRSPESYESPWGSELGAIDGSTDHIRAGYMYNPYEDSSSGRNDRLTSFSADTVLIMDMLQRYSTIPHGGTWNIARADGSVRGANGNSVVSYLQTVERVETDWNLFEPQRDTLAE